MNIRQKFLLTPAVVLTLMLILGAVGFAGLNSAKNSLKGIYNNNYQGFKKSSRVLQDVGAAHADVYRLFTWMNNYSDAQIKSALADINQRVDRAIEVVKELSGAEDLSQDESGKLTVLDEKLVKYRKQVATAIDMAQVDANLGITSMQLADRLYKELQQEVEKIVSDKDQEADSRFERSMTLYKVSVTVFVALVLVAFAIGNFLSFYMSNQIITPLKQAKDAAQRIASGDLTGKIIATQKDETGDLLRSLGEMQNKLHDIIAGMTDGAHELSKMSGRLNSSSQSILQGTAEQHDSASSMAASIEEMSVSINVVSENAHDADESVTEAAQLSSNGRDTLEKMNDSMQKIMSSVNESSQVIQTLGQESERISEIVKVIKDIADQTNLLALNAAIEAARAGDQGRGFAVVADEVRKLAERTANSTQEISLMIQGIQDNTQKAVISMKNGVEIVGAGATMTTEASQAMLEVERKSRVVQGMVNEISSALKEQSTASHEIATHVERIAQMAEQNSASSREADDAVQHMNRLAEKMEGMVGQFRV